MTLSSVWTGLPPLPEQSDGDVGSRPPMDREERRTYALGMEEIVTGPDRKSGSEADPTPSNPGASIPPTAGGRLPAHNCAFPNTEEARRESLGAIRRGAVVTVAIWLASAVFSY
ncbi:MAG: hypothetical protein OXF02_00430 [Simkaniaceae bacterium]|nr:hypothetical protein [Simkaniaceae bacterium]